MRIFSLFFAVGSIVGLAFTTPIAGKKLGLLKLFEEKMNKKQTLFNMNPGALRKPVLFGCFLVLLCCFSRSASADLIAYDGFNYTLGQSVVGQGTNAGWASSGQTYTISSGNSASAYSEVSDIASSFPNLSISGNQLQLDGTNAPGGGAGVYRNLGVAYNTAGNIYWFSVLLQLDNNAGKSYAGVSLFSSSSEQFFFGQRNVSSYWGMEQHAGAGVNSGVSALNSANGLLVVELNGNTHKASLFVNPASLEGSVPVTPSATLTFTDFSFNRFRAQTGNENLDVDELRFGTTYADVTPVFSVPVPSSLALMVLTGMATQLGRRFMLRKG